MGDDPLNRSELAEYLQSRFSLDTNSLDDDVPLFSSGLLDSLNMVDVVAFIEETIGKTMTPEDLSFENLDSIGQILRFARMLASRRDGDG